WSAVSLAEGRETIWLRHGVRKDGRGGWEEAALKTHQQRRIALDSETVAALVEHRRRCEERAATLDVSLQTDAFVFSDAPDGSTFIVPDTITQRYERLVRRLGIGTTLHKLRHYSATELILAGVDVRTVAGRLGHAGGGTTTLRTYTAWVSEADQRAAAGWTTRMPDRAQLEQPRSWASATPQHPYECVAADLARRIDAGLLTSGELAPAAAALADEHEVSLATARRAIALAKEWGVLVTDGAGRYRIVARGAPAAAEPAAPLSQAHAAAHYWSVVVTGPGGLRYPPRMVKGDLADPDSFRSHLVGIVTAEDPSVSGRPENTWIRTYELHVSRPGATEESTILRLG
ncbi:MAG: tyrosine-type recombinase/integrase, partial [Actinomycetia bacterium]|nr:tyrosine-type recombinase/integrase [Actinomycetes bacterium]